MPFHSIVFLLGFLPLCLAGGWLAGRMGQGWIKGWLIGASILFYGLNAPRQLLVLFACLSMNLLLGWGVSRSRRPGVVAGCGVALNLLVLGWFKYVLPAVWPDSGLPPGISFFTFSQIGLLLWLAAASPDRVRAIDQALLSVLFPVIVAGPILNPNEMLPQLRGDHRLAVTARSVAVGLGVFCLGLVKKTVLADPLGGMVAFGFADPETAGAVGAWQAAFGWYLQLYFDFSGYTDMAIGLGMCFGLHLPDNFDQPYRAASVIAYWQRWHMSLTRFLMANVHTPLTLVVLRRRRRLGLPIHEAAQRSLAGFAAMIAGPILVTMLLAGIWHGARASYALFGLVHAGYLAVNHAWRLSRRPALPPVVAIVLTQAAVLVGAVIFRAETPTDAASVFSAMAGRFGLGSLDLHATTMMAWLLGLFLLVWLAPTTRQFMQDPRHNAAVSAFSWRPSPQMAVVLGGLATLGLLASGGTRSFVYFNF